MLKIFRTLFGKRKDVIVDVRVDGNRRMFEVVREVELPKRKPKPKVKRRKSARKTSCRKK